MIRFVKDLTHLTVYQNTKYGPRINECQSMFKACELMGEGFHTFRELQNILARMDVVWEDDTFGHHKYFRTRKIFHSSKHQGGYYDDKTVYVEYFGQDRFEVQFLKKEVKSW